MCDFANSTESCADIDLDKFAHRVYSSTGACITSQENLVPHRERQIQRNHGETVGVDVAQAHVSQRLAPSLEMLLHQPPLFLAAGEEEHLAAGASRRRR
jgi:hypothetical protein